MHDNTYHENVGLYYSRQHIYNREILYIIRYIALLGCIISLFCLKCLRACENSSDRWWFHGLKKWVFLEKMESNGGKYFDRDI